MHYTPYNTVTPRLLPFPEELLQAYQSAKYIIELENPVELRVGSRNEAVERLLHNQGYPYAAFITPENPFSQPLSQAENFARLENFQADLARQCLSFYPGYGVDDQEAWPREKSFLVMIADSLQADELAYRYQQNAYLLIVPGSGVELMVLRQYPT